ncbi:MAG: hypothetical protein AAF918_00355 [Pseudomonadota bacterium]
MSKIIPFKPSTKSRTKSSTKSSTTKHPTKPAASKSQSLEPTIREATREGLSKKERAEGLTLCRRGFHKWRIDGDTRFDVKKGRLVTLRRCERCGKTRVTLD